MLNQNILKVKSLSRIKFISDSKLTLWTKLKAYKFNRVLTYFNRKQKILQTQCNDAAINDRVPAAIGVQNAQECQGADIKTVEVEKRRMKSKSVWGQSSRDIYNDISPILADLRARTRAQVTEIVDYCMAKLHEKLRAEVFETEADMFENALQSSYLDSNEWRKSVMLSMMEDGLKEVVHADWGLVHENLSWPVSCSRKWWSEKSSNHFCRVQHSLNQCQKYFGTWWTGLLTINAWKCWKNSTFAFTCQQISSICWQVMSNTKVILSQHSYYW